VAGVEIMLSLGLPRRAVLLLLPPALAPGCPGLIAAVADCPRHRHEQLLQLESAVVFAMMDDQTIGRQDLDGSFGASDCHVEWTDPTDLQRSGRGASTSCGKVSFAWGAIH
jgi:hypothetical protein